MIVKERDPGEHPEIDKFSKAGGEAEEQMAFYLRRAFVDAPDLWVFNDLRFKDETADRVQIDHLVLHRHGFIIIESKSVSTGVSVNEHGEWVRFWNGRPQGMPSPIEQARRQIEFLRRALHENRAGLLGKIMGLKQMGFVNCPFELLVSISDHGTIKRGMKLPEVVKADQVPGRIRDIIQRHKKARSFFNVNLDMKNMDGLYNFTDEEVNRINHFLLEHHFPLIAESHRRENAGTAGQAREPAASYAPAPESKPVDSLGLCDKCGAQCMILWGRYGYYWKCPACNGNMAIKETCPSCRQKIKLRKDGNRFFSYCDQCHTGETLYCEFETV